MKWNLRTIGLLASLSVASMLPAIAETSVALAGAGATFPAPLYKKWISLYRTVEPQTTINYAAVGSGEGAESFLADRIDFGASDALLTEAQAATAKHGLVSIPVTAGMLVLVYNLPGLNGPLKLSRDSYVALLMGKIPRWNDARIQSTNPDLNLPNRDIVLVARQDSSGTTYALTKHLDAASATWRKRGAGVGKLVQWPANTMLVRGNEGVAARVKLAEGAIGYVEYSYAKHLKLPVASLENKEGRFVVPSEASGNASITSNPGRALQDLPALLADPGGVDAYPIVSLSWLLLKKEYADAAKSAALKRFVMWGIQAGQDSAPELGYLRLPEGVARQGKELLETIH